VQREWRGNKTGGVAEEEKEGRQEEEQPRDGARKREVARRLVGRGARKERQRGKGSTKCT